jgi:hypothetical protein
LGKLFHRISLAEQFLPSDEINLINLRLALSVRVGDRSAVASEYLRFCELRKLLTLTLVIAGGQALTWHSYYYFNL